MKLRSCNHCFKIYAGWAQESSSGIYFLLTHIAADDAMKSSEISAYAPVAELNNAIEAQLLVSILTEQNIPHRLQSFYDTAYDGLFQTHRGWGRLYAPIERKDQIVQILNALREEDFSQKSRPE